MLAHPARSREPTHGGPTFECVVADALEPGRVPGVALHAPEPEHLALAGSHIERVHTPTYVDAIRTGSDPLLASSQGFDWDPGIWQMALHSTAGVVAATEAALTGGVAGSLSSGLHHAKPDRGDGYCTVNGLVVAASAHLERRPGSRVLILDLDAHCGGGTAACLHHAGIADQVRHLDLSTNAFDGYDPIRPTDQLVYVDGGDDRYLADTEDLLATIDWAGTDLVLYNAGMDPHPRISAEALARREEMVFEAAADRGTPVAWVLAGGYTWGISMDELVDLHLLTAETAAPHAR